MTSPPLDSTHGKTTSGVACHHRLWTAHTVKRCQAWHAIIAFGQHTWSNDVGHGMPSSPLGCRNDRTMSSVACHHRRWTSSNSQTALGVACHHPPWTTNKVKRRREWHAIITFGQHRRANNVRRGIPSSPLGSTHGRMTLGVACHHTPWTTNTIEQRRALHDITAFRQHARSNDVGCDMPSWPLDSTHGRTRSSVACHHSPWTANTVKRRRARHAIIAFGLADTVRQRRA